VPIQRGSSSLSSNFTRNTWSRLTAIGNDYDFKDVFARQVEGFGKPGDVLIAFSTSGRSENVRRALIAARERGLDTISFLGKEGGSCTGLADVELLVASKSTARIQEMHKLLLHTICELTEEQL
jgi:D-sedoheptulose 7-phosphate isomerase